MSEILKSIKARLNRLKKIEEEHKKNTDEIIRQKQENTQEKCFTQSNEPEKSPDKECFFIFSANLKGVQFRRPETERILAAFPISKRLISNHLK